MNEGRYHYMAIDDRGQRTIVEDKYYNDLAQAKADALKFIGNTHLLEVFITDMQMGCYNLLNIAMVGNRVQEIQR